MAVFLSTDLRPMENQSVFFRSHGRREVRPYSPCGQELGCARGATGMLDYLDSGPDDDSPPDFFDPYSLPPFCVEQMKRKWRVLARWCEEAAHMRNVVAI